MLAGDEPTLAPSMTVLAMLSGICDMFRASKKSSGATLPSTVIDTAEHHHHHHEPPVPLLSPKNFHSATSLSTESSAGSRHRYPNLFNFIALDPYRTTSKQVEY